MKSSFWDKYFYKFIFNFASTKKRFTTIYERNFWSSEESVSGPGSNLNNTITVREVLPGILKKYQVKSFLDLPCGDFHWMKLMNLQGIDYIGGDIVEGIIKNNIAQYGNQSGLSFKVIDLIKDDLPTVDLLMVRDCFIHLSNDLIDKSINNIKKSGIKYLLTNNHPDIITNKNIKTGTWRRINLTKDPFNLPEPLESWEETEHLNEIEGRKLMVLYKVGEL